MKQYVPVLVASVASFLLAGSSLADEKPHAFVEQVRPFLETYCLDCHDGTKPKADVNLERFELPDQMWQDPKLWERVLTQLRDKVMPPPKKKQQPSDDERSHIADWISHTLRNPDEKQLPRDPGPNVIQRLSRLEYNCTVRDLLGVDSHPADVFPPDGGGGGGFDNNAATLFIPPVLLEQYLDAAGKIMNAAKSELLFSARPYANLDEAKAARQSLSALATRAFRRPLLDDEPDRLMRVYTSARSRGDSWEGAVKLAGKAILVSPHFLFRIEGNREEATEPYRIGDWELASRLSYFLWSSMPDTELFRLAGEGRLHEPAVLEAQVRRMLSDAKTRIFAENFASQWLRTKELKDGVSPAPDKFPQFTRELREAFYEEPIEFFLALFSGNHPVTDLLDSDYTFANQTLAKFYGIAETAGEKMRRVSLPDRNRGGVLGMGGVLALTSYPRRTSPVLRGKWVMEEILGTPPPPPPPLVDTKKVERRGDGESFRKRLEQHREDPACAGCHARMDPLGFGLENYDPIGAWRTETAGAPVDASGQLVSGEKFVGPAEMKTLLMQKKDEFTRNLTEKLLAYALGRGLESTDWWPVQQISRAVAADHYGAETMVLEIVKSFPFQYKRPGAVTTAAETNR